MAGIHGKYIDWGTWKFYYPKGRDPYEMEVQPGDSPLSPNAVSPSVSDAAQCARLYECTRRTIARYFEMGRYVREEAPEAAAPAKVSDGPMGFVNAVLVKPIDAVLVKPIDAVLVKPLKGVTQGGVDAVDATRKLLLAQTDKLLEGLKTDASMKQKEATAEPKGSEPSGMPKVDATPSTNVAVATAA